MLVRTVHLVLVLLALLPWALGMLAFSAALGLVLVADQVWPGATWGNCWSFAGPRWARDGGYLALRWTPGTRILHALWIHRLPVETGLLQTEPVRRHKGWRAVLSSPYFPYRGIRRERRSHDAKRSQE